MNQPGFILVVDGDAASRDLIRASLDRIDLPVRATSSGNEALAVAAAERPTLVVLEVRLPDITGYEVCRELRERHGDDVAILFVSGERTEEADRVAGLLLGADDYLVKPFAVDDLVGRVRRLLARTVYTVPPAEARFAVLTAREREVLRLLAGGLDQSEIAERLSISPKTVGTHIQRILEKLDVRSRAQAVAVAHREGLLSNADVEGHLTG